MDVSDRQIPSSERELNRLDDDSTHRPLSYYENNNNPAENRSFLLSNDNATPQKNQGDFTINTVESVYLSTTVPQNIAMQDIAGKHTPTRNSLRHSRMVVLNKLGQSVATNTISTNLRFKNLGKLLLIGVSLIGGILSAISLWLLLWSPNLRAMDNPYFSAIPALISGFLGITYLTCCFKECTSSRQLIYWLKSFKYISITTSVVAAAASFVIFFFSLTHLIALTSMTCSPPGKLDSTCLCKRNSTEETLLIESYHYVDLSCAEVNNVLWSLILVICIANAVLLLLELVYLYLHWISRNVYEYSRVPMNMGALNFFKASG